MDVLQALLSAAATASRARQNSPEEEGLWQFQRDRRQAGRQQPPQERNGNIRQAEGHDQRTLTGRSASTSQPSYRAGQEEGQQHSSWALQDSTGGSKDRARGRRQPGTRPPSRTQARSPTRHAQQAQRSTDFQDDGDAFWNEERPASGHQGRQAGLGNRSNSSTRGFQQRDSPTRSQSQEAQNQNVGSRWVETEEPVPQWGEASRGFQQRGQRQQGQGRHSERDTALRSGRHARRGRDRAPPSESLEAPAYQEPWQQMALGKKDAREVERKARVQVAIACNKITLTAFEQFSAQIQSADRVADRQEILNDFLVQLGDTLQGNEGCLDTINVSGALQKLAAACCAVPPLGEILLSARALFQQLIELALQLEATFKIDAINNTIGALAKLSNHGTAQNLLPVAGSDEAFNIQVLLEGFAVKAWNRLSQPPAPEAHQLALLVWGYSRLSLDPLGGKLFNLVVQKAEPMIGQFEFQNISNVLLAAATLDKQLPEDFLERMARQAILKMPQASPQGIGNLLWATAKLTRVPPVKGELFRAAMSRASEVIDDFSLQNVANLFWAAVQLEYKLTPKMLIRLTNVALKNVEGANPIAIAGLLMSYTKMESLTGEELLFLACIQEVDKKLELCNAQTMSNLIWSLGSVKADLPLPLLGRLDDAWAEQALTLLEGLWGQTAGWGQNVGNILWGYSQLRMDPMQGRFFQKVLSRLAPDDLEVMEASHVSSILMAAGKLQRKSFTPDFLNQALKLILAKGGAQEICNTMWALTALGLMQRPAMRSLSQRLEAVVDGSDMQPSSARQFLTANAILTSGGKASSHSEAVPQALLEKCQAAVLEHPQPPSISEFHEDVSRALETMGVPHAIEFSSPDGLLSIDIVARCGDGKPLAIEVDGKDHFTRMPPYRPLGHTTIRNQIIAGLGFRGVGIPFYDWHSLASPADKVSYVTARMAKWGIAPHAL